MAFKVNFDKNSNKLELHNMSQYKMPTSLPIREEVSDVKYGKLLTSLGLIVFMPTDGFEEFIYKFSNTPILGKYR